MPPTPRLLLALLVAGSAACSPPVSDRPAPRTDLSPDYDIAAYYFPNYHPTDDRNNSFHGPGWSEWTLVRNATPRFPGHQQPKIPLWGYTDESDPKEMARKIDAATDHGIDAFIFDWYYYDDGPFLEKALEQGFFGAPNRHRLRFALMWANHDWMDIHPLTKKGFLDGPDVLHPGAVSPSTWERMTGDIITAYFEHPSYWLIDGRPYFSIYDLTRFIAIFGGVEATAQAISDFREKVRAAGFPDLNLNAVVWGQTILPGERPVDDVTELIEALGFDSFTSYVWIHHVPLRQFPQTPYLAVQREYFEYAEAASQSSRLPYYPNVTMGWDSSPRTHQEDPFEPLGYPFMATLSGNTPQAFEGALVQVKAFLDEEDRGHRLFNINCWNEWTEGSYLEPDTTNGMAYLEAIREVFGTEATGPRPPPGAPGGAAPRARPTPGRR